MSGNLVRFRDPNLHRVLDTWPVMEWLKGRQPAADQFDCLIRRAVCAEIVLSMSVISLGEMYYICGREWGQDRADAVLSRTRELPINMILASEENVLSAARLKMRPGISYADAFAAGLAIRLDCPLITGDADFRALEEAGLLRLECLGA